ncbi:MAG: nuclear transport factor 2 family protein [Planctomycetota bacterium]
MSLLLACAALQGCAVTHEHAPYAIEEGDREAILAALQDYVDGFVLGQPELLERSLSPTLAKKGYRRDSPDEAYGDAVPLSFEAALELSASLAASADSRVDSPSSVEVFEIADKTAAGKVTAFWGIDYVHLVKEADGRWMIHHVIWQTAPEPAGE